ncbi:MAG TPA: sugar transferase [Dehalococcoidia bacterium]|nr:sugar transferase [Dehalococcoidia bacterium]
MSTGQAPDFFHAAITHIPSPRVDEPDADTAPAPSAEPCARADGFYRRRGKRTLDATLGPLLALAFLPLIALVSLAVLLTSGRPIFYGSERIGLGGRRFLMWKFRTMVADADLVYESWKHTHPHLATELTTTWQLPHDPRVTPLGGFLRRSSLDELPQFWNVLRGEMSLVGPRPYLEREEMAPELARAIHSVKPGLTGPFQVRGRKGLSPQARMQIEANYARDVRFARDLRYMLRTIAPLLKLDGR